MGTMTHLRLSIWFLLSMKEEKLKQASDKNGRKENTLKKANQPNKPPQTQFAYDHIYIKLYLCQLCMH